jgi:acetamidase/formamidase
MHHSCTYTIHNHQHHFGWDNSLPPALHISPGESLFFHCLDSSAGQIQPNATLETVANLDFSRVNPVSGPVYIDGAEPGDILKVSLHKFHPSAFGWTANIPGFGLLADQFPSPALHLWHYDAHTLAPCAYGPGGRVPLKPFAGTIGLALAEPGNHSVVPPRRVGGNMDIRDLGAGTVLYLPVEVAGGLFSIGDTHGAQGDGEVCGTAIESQMDIELTLELIKQTPLASPRFTTPGPVSRHLDGEGFEVTTGIGPDLFHAAREAVMRMVDLLGAQHHMAAIDAYMLASVCGDLRISQIVDMPNWTVSFYFPRLVLA